LHCQLANSSATLAEENGVPLLSQEVMVAVDELEKRIAGN
jgi:hypothetical protein